MTDTVTAAMVAFVTSRLDDREAAARAFADDGWVVAIYGTPGADEGDPSVAVRLIGGPKPYARIFRGAAHLVDWGHAVHNSAITLWSLQQELREIKAQRFIIRSLDYAEPGSDHWVAVMAQIGHLAEAHDDHLEYHPEWSTTPGGEPR
jgi:hypothetical protein